MDSPATNRPPLLRQQFSNTKGLLVIRVEVGPSASPTVIADRIDGLSTLTDVGERWGVELARLAADWDLRFEVDQRGPEAAREALRYSYGFPRWMFGRWSRVAEIGRSTADPEWVALRDVLAGQLLGDPPIVRRLEYRNPVELVLIGSGMLMVGAVMAARLVRDWSAQRRGNAAIAEEAEAEAKITADRARLYRWMVDEAMRGASPIPIGDLVQMVTPPEIKSLSRLSEDPVRLELPKGSE